MTENSLSINHIVLQYCWKNSICFCNSIHKHFECCIKFSIFRRRNLLWLIVQAVQLIMAEKLQWQELGATNHIILSVSRQRSLGFCVQLILSIFSLKVWPIYYCTPLELTFSLWFSNLDNLFQICAKIQRV